MAKIAEYFTDDELKCKCGCETHGVSTEARLRLNALRSLVGKPMSLSSAYRCPNHPEERKKSSPGWHSKGLAFDVKIPNSALRSEILKYAGMLGFNGLGFAKSFLHIDLRPEPATWFYS